MRLLSNEGGRKQEMQTKFYLQMICLEELLTTKFDAQSIIQAVEINVFKIFKTYS
jgi:hypothetical protein